MVKAGTLTSVDHVPANVPNPTIYYYFYKFARGGESEFVHAWVPFGDDYREKQRSPDWHHIPQYNEAKVWNAFYDKYRKGALGASAQEREAGAKKRLLLDVYLAARRRLIEEARETFHSQLPYEGGRFPLLAFWSSRHPRPETVVEPGKRAMINQTETLVNHVSLSAGRIADLKPGIRKALREWVYGTEARLQCLGGWSNGTCSQMGRTMQGNPSASWTPGEHDKLVQEWCGTDGQFAADPKAPGFGEPECACLTANPTDRKAYPNADDAARKSGLKGTTWRPTHCWAVDKCDVDAAGINQSATLSIAQTQADCVEWNTCDITIYGDVNIKQIGNDNEVNLENNCGAGYDAPGSKCTSIEDWLDRGDVGCQFEDREPCYKCATSIVEGSDPAKVTYEKTDGVVLPNATYKKMCRYDHCDVSTKTRAPTFEECQTMCTDDPECRGFNVFGLGDRHCYFLNESANKKDLVEGKAKGQMHLEKKVAGGNIDLMRRTCRMPDEFEEWKKYWIQTDAEDHQPRCVESSFLHCMADGTQKARNSTDRRSHDPHECMCKDGSAVDAATGLCASVLAAADADAAAKSLQDQQQTASAAEDAANEKARSDANTWADGQLAECDWTLEADACPIGSNHRLDDIDTPERCFAMVEALVAADPLESSYDGGERGNWKNAPYGCSFNHNTRKAMWNRDRAGSNTSGYKVPCASCDGPLPAGGAGGQSGSSSGSSSGSFSGSQSGSPNGGGGGGGGESDEGISGGMVAAIVIVVMVGIGGALALVWSMRTPDKRGPRDVTPHGEPSLPATSAAALQNGYALPSGADPAPGAALQYATTPRVTGDTDLTGPIPRARSQAPVARDSFFRVDP